MKEVKRINTVVVNLQQQARFASRQDLYAINVDRKRNYYNCGGFGHIARNHRN